MSLYNYKHYRAAKRRAQRWIRTIKKKNEEFDEKYGEYITLRVPDTKKIKGNNGTYVDSRDKPTYK